MVTKRGDIYQLVRRVPLRYRSVEDRETVWISLHTDSRSVADLKAPIAWTEMIQSWQARLRGDSTDAEARFDAAKELAATRGFRHLPVTSVVKLPIPLKQAILMLAALWYERREAGVFGDNLYVVPFGAHDLLQSYRAWVVRDG